MSTEQNDTAQIEEFVIRIKAHWRASVTGIMEAGKVLVEAKNKLSDDSKFAAVIKKLPFTEKTVRRLMVIGRCPFFTPDTCVHLPPHWGTLYELTRLSEKEFHARIEDGTINPDMQRKDVFPKTAKATRRKSSGASSNNEPEHEDNSFEDDDAALEEIDYGTAYEALCNIMRRLDEEKSDVPDEIVTVLKFLSERLADLVKSNDERYDDEAA